jgi:hypothetical protein
VGSPRIAGYGAALALAASVVARAFVAGAQAPAPQAAIDFARDIRPILQTSCFKCHGPTRSRGNLQLHERALAMRGGDSGPVILPGRGADSLLVRRVIGIPGEDRMPMEADALAPAQIALLRAWIDQGARWPETMATATPAAPERRHWAYVAPVAPPPPDVGTSPWVRNDLDRFVLDRLNQERLTPSPEASFETLVRLWRPLRNRSVFYPTDGHYRGNHRGRRRGFAGGSCRY